MEPKNSKIFNKEMLQTVSAYCESQKISDVDNFIFLCFKQGFDIKRYGFLGKPLNENEKHLNIDDNGENDLKTDAVQEKWVEKEIIIEKRVEIPVEVIKEIEKIIEVPVEVIKEVIVEKEIIKEVPVEKVVTKIEYISDKTTEDELGGIITELKNEMTKKDKDLYDLKQSLDSYKENDKTQLLQETLQSLRSELQQKNQQINELEKINRELLNGGQNQAYLLRGSNLNRRI